MDFNVDPHLTQLAAHATEVGRAAAAQRAIREDGWLIGHDPAFARELASLGWIGMTWPRSVGGHGRSPIERFVVYEQLISQGAPLAASYFADRQIGPVILQYGTDEQKAQWLPGIVAGTSTWCVGMSEPDAGSDVAAIRTRADQNPDGSWTINGAKVWTSGAQHADWCYLVARSDLAAPPHQGMSEFVVAMDSPGISVQPIKDATGDDHFCAVTFDDVAVPADHLIGERNNSFRQVMRQMEHERGGIDRLVSNRRLLMDCMPFVATKATLVRQELMRLTSTYEIARLLVLREVLGQAPRAFSAAAKTLCTEYEQRVASFCAQSLGAASTAGLWPSEDATLPLGARVARGVVYAPAYTVMGGTTQILRNIIAERLLGLPRQ